ncbi:MAG TPA: site-specific DNA-methyltransferase, partial [Ignavibacteriaceae bacterium]|nr:site-specific DNA-methyltransferase [Ignavibacteriaceae bacterium]
LLALHSLLPVYRGRVKLIYIDPPFNTASAANTFSYNNSFNHSTWLTFMRNRIAVAKQFLKDDGLFILSIDHNELFYLGMLVDETLGSDNRIGIVAVETNPRGRSDSKFFATSSEYLIVYAKNPLLASIGNFALTDEQIEDFNQEDDISKYRLLPFRRSGSNSTPKERPNLFYPIYFDEKSNYIGLEATTDSVEILPLDKDKQKRVWRHGKDSFIEAVDSGDIVIKKYSGNIFSILLKDRIKEGRKPKTIWTNPLYDASSHGTNLIKKLFGEKVFSYPKSIHLMKDILRITTNNNDFVLDFFGGSGTTAAAVMELNLEDKGTRKFIICEQMNYVESVTKERIKQNINLNKIGSLTYCELAELNQMFVNQIKLAKTPKELKTIWSSIKKDGFISYKVMPSEIDKNITEFEELSFADQKKFLIAVLDKNHLYVNYSEIDDKAYNISSDDKKLNKKFYSLK